MTTSALSMVLVTGLPGSGKSSYIRANLNHAWAGNTLICFDTLRKAFGHVYHRSTEPQVNALACSMVRVAFMEGRDVVVDESITTPGVAMDLIGVAREFKALVRLVHLVTPVDVCRQRRVPAYMPEADFDRKLGEWAMYGKLIMSLADERINLEIVSGCPVEGRTFRGTFCQRMG